MELRPYQQNALDYVEYLPSFALFMGTGTGKTITSLVRSNDNPTTHLLIICPNNVVEQWKETITTLFPKYAKILDFDIKDTSIDKKKKIFENEDCNCIIVNYDIVHKLDLHLIVDKNWTIILDESHRIKNIKAKVTNACLKIGEKTIFKIILTATPTQANYGGYVEYYPQLKFLGYITMQFKTFCSYYVLEELKTFQGNKFATKIIKGYKNTNELDDILKICCVRYEAKFGDFEPQHNYIMLPKPKEYNKMLREKTIGKLVLKNGARKRIAMKTICTGVVDGLDFFDVKTTYESNTIKIDWLEDFLKDTSEIVAIYYQYNVELAQLEKLMKKLGKKYEKINGNTKDKYEIMNKNKYDVLLCQYQSASEGLDGLQSKCHIEVLFALPESSIHYKQSIGRIDRDGQTKVPMYYYLICEKTIEETISKMIKDKVDFNNEVLNRLALEEND
jgi:SNF2 family DNA or RNA helicase